MTDCVETAFIRPYLKLIRLIAVLFVCSAVSRNSETAILHRKVTTVD